MWKHFLRVFIVLQNKDRHKIETGLKEIGGYTEQAGTMRLGELFYRPKM